MSEHPIVTAAFRMLTDPEVRRLKAERMALWKTLHHNECEHARETYNALTRKLADLGDV